MIPPIPRLVLVDDHIVIRNALARLLESGHRYQVTCQFDHGLDFVRAFPFDPAPDLILLDLSMPLMDGWQVLQWIREHQVPYPVLALTFQLHPGDGARLRELGARGCLEKSCTITELTDAIDGITGLNRSAAGPGMPVHPLTKREQEFLRLVSSDEEYTYKEIAACMGVHPRTVDGYRESLFHKLQVKARSGLILYAVRHRMA